MAHLIKELDFAFRLEGTESSWHNLEKPTLNFDLLKMKVSKERIALPENYVFANEGNSYNIMVQHPNGKIIVGPTCSNEYVVSGNDVIFDKIHESFERHNIPAKLIFGLTMKNCLQMALTFEVEGANEFFIGNDQHKMNIVVVTGHDKTMGTQIFGNSIRVVCQNTMKLAMKQKKAFDFHMFHNQKGEGDFQNIHEIIEGTLLHAEEYSKFGEKLGNTPITIEKAKQLYMGMISHGEVTTQQINKVNGLVELFQNGKGNYGENLYDIVNGVTEFFSTGGGLGKGKLDINKFANANLFGKIMDSKVDMVSKLMTHDNEIDFDEIEMLSKKGERLLKEYETRKEKELVLV